MPRDRDSVRRSRSRSPRGDWGRDERNKYASKRSRSPSPGPSAPSKRRRYSPSRSRSRDRKTRARAASVSSASSSDSDRRRRKSKKDGKRSKSKERERRERKERKREKKERKERKKKAGAHAHASQWGKHGLITELDIFAKASEFNTWLVEERKINPETISKEQSKKEFARFVEDYNTATLPHEKYYNMEAYDKRMAAMRSGEFLPPTDEYDLSADMKALSGAHKKKSVGDDSSYLSKEHLMELRKVQNERVEVGKMKLLGMDTKSMGVRMELMMD